MVLGKVRIGIRKSGLPEARLWTVEIISLETVLKGKNILVG